MHTASLLFKKAGLEPHLPDRYSSGVTEPGSSIPIFYTSFISEVSMLEVCKLAELLQRETQSLSWLI